MNSYALQRLFEKTDSLNFSRVFEITDLDIDYINDNLGLIEVISEFGNRYGHVGPALRDQAYSFDAGLVLLSSMQSLEDPITAPGSKYLKFKDKHYDQMAKCLRNKSVKGVTGEISFNDRGYNKNNGLKYMVFDKHNNQWRKVNLLTHN